MHYKTKIFLKQVATMMMDLLLAILMIVGMFLLVAVMAPSPKAKDLPENPSGRPKPTKKYLPEKPSKKPLKPSKLPELPTIPQPAFKSLQAPSKLPAAQFNRHK